MPKGGEYLLDSNAIIALFRGEPSFLSQFATVDTFVPSIALGERYFGAFKSSQIAANIAPIDSFASNVTALVCDAGTSRVYGLVKDRLKKLGKPIPENDIWIAAVAPQHDLILETRDAHFQSVQDLVSQAW